MADWFKQQQKRKKLEYFYIETKEMSVSPPEAPPYPTTPEENHPDDEASLAAYAQILVRLFF